MGRAYLYHMLQFSRNSEGLIFYYISLLLPFRSQEYGSDFGVHVSWCLTAFLTLNYPGFTKKTRSRNLILYPSSPTASDTDWRVLLTVLVSQFALADSLTKLDITHRLALSKCLPSRHAAVFAKAPLITPLCECTCTWMSIVTIDTNTDCR
jgi:hypothetical protein